MKKINISYLLWVSLLFSLAAVPAWAQVTATIQNTAEGQSNGAISLNFPEGYPTDQLEGIVWYPLDADHNYIPDGSGNATVQPDDDPTTPIEIGGLSAGWYRVVYNRVGWCNGAAKDFEVQECAPNVFPTFVVSSDCGADALGSISITNSVVGNTYQWSNGATTPNLIDVAAGTYTVTVSDANGCSAWGGATILNNDFSVAYYEYCDPTSNEFALDITATGQPPFTYIINGNTTLSSESNTFTTPPLPTPYDILITDAAGCATPIDGTHNCGCPFTANITGECAPPNLSFSLDFNCATGPYTYQYSHISNNGTTIAGQGTIDNNATYAPAPDLFGIINPVNYTFTDVFENEISMQTGCCEYELFSVQVLGGSSNCLSGNAHFWVKATGSPPFEISTPAPASLTSSPTSNDELFEVTLEGAFGIAALIVENADGCTRILNIQCHEVSVGGSDAGILPCPIVDAPILWNTNLTTLMPINDHLVACVGQTICIDYYTSNLSGIYAVTCSDEAFVAQQAPLQGIHNYQGSARHYQSGTFCWLPSPDEVGTHKVSLLAAGYTPDGCLSYGQKTYTLTVLPQPTVTSWQPQVLSPLVRDCKGDVFQPALVQVGAQYDVSTAQCAPAFTLNGLNSNSIELSECGTQTIILNYEGLDIPLSVAIPETQLDGSELQLTADITHSHSNCGDDICDGAVTVEVLGGSGQYEYEWSDGCQSSPDCSGAWHGNLCSGNYSVTVTDSQTGCTAQANFSVGMYVSQGNISVLTYTAAAELIKPDIRLAPALFDSQTKVEYTLPEDGFVTIKVYNLQGILVETLLSNEYRTAGNYQINDEGGEYANGLYLFSLEVCNRNKAVIGIKW